MTDLPESEFQPFTPDQFDAIGKTVTENTGLEMYIDGATRTAMVFIINNSDDVQGERDALDGALAVAKILDVPSEAVIASGYTIIKEF